MNVKEFDFFQQSVDHSAQYKINANIDIFKNNITLNCAMLVFIFDLEISKYLSVRKI